MKELRDARTIDPEALFERRLQAVKLHNEEGISKQNIASIVGVNRNTITRWLQLWEKGGVKALKAGKAGAPKGCNATLDQAMQKKIQYCLIDRTPDQLRMPFALWTRAAVQKLIKDLAGFNMPIRTVGHYLKQWGFTPQKPLRVAHERCEKKVEQWLKVEYPALCKRAKKENGEIHWGDETGINSEDQVGRGYAPKGKTPIRFHQGKPEKVNMISTVTNQGKVRFMFYNGSMNADRLISFLKRLIKDAKKKVFLVLDNLRVHHSKAVKDWIKENVSKIEIIYLPSYSPDLNPDEYLNCDLKEALTKTPGSRVRGKLRQHAETHMRSLAKQPERVKSYFNAKSIKYAA